jgi:hypothetical protein
MWYVYIYVKFVPLILSQRDWMDIFMEVQIHFEKSIPLQVQVTKDWQPVHAGDISYTFLLIVRLLGTPSVV